MITRSIIKQSGITKGIISHLTRGFLINPIVDSSLTLNTAALQGGLTKAQLFNVDGSDIDSWNSINGTVHSATQATSANKPQYVDNAFGNGRPGVRFDGVDDYLDITSLTQDHFNDFTIFVVANFDIAKSGDNSILVAQDSGTGTGRAIIFKSTLDEIGSFLGGAVTNAGTVSFAPQVYAVKNDSSTVTVYKDGVAGSPTARTVVSADGIWSIGRDTDSTAFIMCGDIGEIILYDRALSEAEIDKVSNGYLSPKWIT